MACAAGRTMASIGAIASAREDGSMAASTWNEDVTSVTEDEAEMPRLALVAWRSPSARSVGRTASGHVHSAGAVAIANGLAERWRRRLHRCPSLDITGANG
jgi:hypothetical protein